MGLLDELIVNSAATPPFLSGFNDSQGFRSGSGNFAMFVAIRRASPPRFSGLTLYGYSFRGLSRDNVRTLAVHSSVCCVRTTLFRWRREQPVEERAKLMARMVSLIVQGLQTKSYDEFVESFSNPGDEPTSFERLNRQLRFQMRISPTCWYDAIVEYGRTPGGNPHFYIEGGGDDWGVLISGDALADHRIGVDFYVPTGSQSGGARSCAG